MKTRRALHGIGGSIKETILSIHKTKIIRLDLWWTWWNLWLPTLLQEKISRLAADRGIPASQLAKEWLWEKLQPLLSSTP